MNNWKSSRKKIFIYNTTIATDRRDEISSNWLKIGNLKIEIEGMIVTTQDQTFRNKYVGKVMDKENISASCTVRKKIRQFHMLWQDVKLWHSESV